MNHPVFAHEAMATYFEITIADHPPGYARQAAAAAFRELDRLEGVLSRFEESSDIARANRLSRGDSIVIGDDALECLLIAADAALATGRAFDPSFASARAAGAAVDTLPFTLAPASHTLTSHAERLHLDLGAIGKGYALDRMAETLREWGVTAACLNSGGSTALAMGAPRGVKGWLLGVGAGRGHRTLELQGVALSASGTAVKGSHLIDPRRGAAAQRTSRVWALAANGALADALSTAFFVMPDAEVAAFCAAHPETGAALTGPGDDVQLFGALRDLLGVASAPP